MFRIKYINYIIILFLVIITLISCNTPRSFWNKKLGIEIPFYIKRKILIDSCFLGDCDIQHKYYFNEKNIYSIVNSITKSFLYNGPTRNDFYKMSQNEKDNICKKLVEKDLIGYWRKGIHDYYFMSFYDNKNRPYSSNILPENFTAIGSSVREEYDIKAFLDTKEKVLSVKYFSY